jgi:hypothetical protein
MLNQLLGALLRAIAMSGPACELNFVCARNPIPCRTPSTDEEASLRVMATLAFFGPRRIAT